MNFSTELILIAIRKMKPKKNKGDNMNNSLKEIGQVLLEAETVMIYPHINIDGDAMGSAAAICRMLRKKGKTAYILIEDEVPANLKFMDRDYCTFDCEIIERADVSLCVDCGDYGRFPKRREAFEKGKKSICIDHHRTSEGICDYNYIDSNAAATGEIIFALLKEIKEEADVEIGEDIFAAITTDTGNFQYSNTNSRSHEIAAELINWGVDTNSVSIRLYENERLQKLMIQAVAISNLRMLCNGKCAVTWLSLDEMNKAGAEPFETDGIIDAVRSIAGVEIAAFVKEKEAGVLRVSFRAKSDANVAEIAAKFGGGGHVKAAGCTLSMNLRDGIELIKKELEEAIN